ncbi:MAG: polysaccharide lyase family 7 protein [Verrucomicrobiales bacterium]|nr:polysaccharide lyase family 7 protein [Verrucomicrobiales bacterium]
MSTRTLVSRTWVWTWGGLGLALATATAWAAVGPLPISGVVASADDGNVAANALDGSLATRWSAKGDGQWIRLDLGVSKLVTSLGCAWYKGNLRRSLFDVEVSGDGLSWTRLYSGSSSGSTLAEEAYELPDALARYVRLVGHGNSVDTWNSLSEVRVFGDVPPPVEVAIVPTRVWATSSDGNLPGNTLDGSLDTRWSAFGAGQAIMYDLGSARTTTSLDVAWHKGNERSTRFEVQTSADAGTWVPVFIGVTSGTTAGLETVDVGDSVGRYLRIVGYGNTLNDWNSISEVEVYGLASTTTTNPPPPVGTTNLPSTVLNLTNWKLTVPLNTAHSGSPDEYMQPELATFRLDPYFKVNESGNGVVFRAHCGGYTTSGSSYPRSELREMTNNGTKLASWSTTVGTHTMVVTQAITHLPDVKNHVVAGQIHDANDDVIVYRLEGPKLFIDLNGNAGPVLDPAYELGRLFTVKFVARGGKIECHYNGRLVYTYTKSATGCYFKAGCYTQSNLSRGDAASAYGEVVIYGLSVTHQ